MISTLEVAPSPMLQPYIKSFSLREFDTSNHAVGKPLHANHEIYLAFNLNDKAPRPINYKGYAEDQSFIFGLQSSFHGVLHFNGHFRLFCIVFKPSGFHQLFSIPPAEFTDLTFGATDVFAAFVSNLQHQLLEASNFSNMVIRTEIALASQLRKKKYEGPYNSIQKTSNLLVQYSGNVSIKWLAYQSNMSLKTFERTFTAQVGISPKLFARITRFNAALNLKITNNRKEWTSIAHECGYFDQMHFIKDFKAFAGESPSRFFKTSPIPEEDIQCEY